MQVKKNLQSQNIDDDDYKINDDDDEDGDEDFDEEYFGDPTSDMIYDSPLEDLEAGLYFKETLE